MIYFSWKNKLKIVFVKRVKSVWMRWYYARRIKKLLSDNLVELNLKNKYKYFVVFGILVFA